MTADPARRPPSALGPKKTAKTAAARRARTEHFGAGAREAAASSPIRAAIARIPRGMVSTYGAVARAAGLPRGARQVAALLRRHSMGLPWHRVVGAGGEIKLRGHSAFEQRFRLQAEGVRFR